jgi:hypothetical protein
VTIAPDTSGLPPGASLLPQHQKKSYDVDDKDFFWEAAGALPFPKASKQKKARLKIVAIAVSCQPVLSFALSVACGMLSMVLLNSILITGSAAC